jgi:F-type H+-transporting ATPase subunit delta
MKEPRAANRYAKAILQLAEKQKKIQRLSADFTLIEEMIKQSKEFRLFLESPVINNGKKKRAVKALFENKVDELTLKFLLLLAAKNREAILQSIIFQFNCLLDEKNNIVNAEVTTVVPFTESQTSDLKRRLESLTKKTVRLSYKIDPKLIGGFHIKIQDQVFDGSILQQFKLIRDRFADAGIHS